VKAVPEGGSAIALDGGDIGQELLIGHHYLVLRAELLRFEDGLTNGDGHHREEALALNRRVGHSDLHHRDLITKNHGTTVSDLRNVGTNGPSLGIGLLVGGVRSGLALALNRAGSDGAWQDAL